MAPILQNNTERAALVLIVLALAITAGIASQPEPESLVLPGLIINGVILAVAFGLVEFFD